MTRKRFIKLLMSHGVSRNNAVLLANDFNSRNIPYERAYSILSTLKPKVLINVPYIIDVFDNSYRVLRKAFENMAAIVKRASTSLAVLIRNPKLMKEGESGDE